MVARHAEPVTRMLKDESRRIKGFTDDLIASKLMAMGVLPGSVIRIIRRAPMDGGYYLQINGQNIALRVKEAESIIVD